MIATTLRPRSAWAPHAGPPPKPPMVAPPRGRQPPIPRCSTDNAVKRNCLDSWYRRPRYHPQRAGELFTGAKWCADHWYWQSSMQSGEVVGSQPTFAIRYGDHPPAGARTGGESGVESLWRQRWRSSEPVSTGATNCLCYSSRLSNKAEGNKAATPDGTTAAAT